MQTEKKKTPNETFSVCLRSFTKNRIQCDLFLIQIFHSEKNRKDLMRNKIKRNDVVLCNRGIKTVS